MKRNFILIPVVLSFAFQSVAMLLPESVISNANASPLVLDSEEVVTDLVTNKVLSVGSFEQSSITERIREELMRVIEIEGVIPESFEITNIYTAIESDEWPEGVCLEVKYIEEHDLTGEVCFYVDGRKEVSEIFRLDHYTFNSWSYPLPTEDSIGHISRVTIDEIPGDCDNKNGRLEYRGAFVEGNWIGDFHFPQISLPNDYEVYRNMVNNILANLHGAFSDNAQDGPIFETQQSIRSRLQVGFYSVSAQIGLDEYRDTWLGAEVAYRFPMHLPDGQGTTLCLFRDKAEGQSPSVRLDQLREVNWWTGEVLGTDVLSDADGSLIVAERGSSTVFYLLFVKDEWIGAFEFHDVEKPPDDDTVELLFQHLSQTLQNLSADVPFHKMVYTYGEALENSWYGLALPEGMRLGPIYRYYGNPELFQFIYVQDEVEPVGQIRYFQEMDQLTHAAESSFDSGYRKCDYNFHYVTDYRASMYYDLGVDGISAFIGFSQEKYAPELEGIGQALYSAVEEARGGEFMVVDEAVEEDVWGCFPADDEMLFSDFRPAYVRSVQYSSQGYIYRMDYLDQTHPVGLTQIILRNYPYPPSRVSLLRVASSLREFPEIEEDIYFGFAESIPTDEDIQFHLKMHQGTNIVELLSKVGPGVLSGPYAWLNDPNNTYVSDIYVQLAKEMTQCLAEKGTVDAIAVPGEIDKEALDESYLRDLLIVSDQASSEVSSTGYLLGEPAELDITNWAPNGIHLKLWPSREFDEKLTYAIYNVEYDTVLFLQQNKYVIKGDLIHTRLTVDRELLFTGENVLLIWTGDTLIAYRPFTMTYGNRGE